MWTDNRERSDRPNMGRLFHLLLVKKICWPESLLDYTTSLFGTFIFFVQILQILVGYLNKLLPETKKRPLLSSANNGAKSEIENYSLEARTRPLNQSAFLHSPVGKASARNAGDLGLIPGSGSSPGEGNGNPIQYSCLENPMDRGAWQATVHGIPRVGHDLAHFFFFPISSNLNRMTQDTC